MAEAETLETTEEINSLIERYPAESRYIIPIMHDLQRKYNYLPRKALETTAAYVNVPFSRVYSMATFYKAFSLTPKGKFMIKCCDGTTCHIKGSQNLVSEIHDTLGINPGETTDDHQFSLETVNCIGACAIAPAMIINEKVYSHVTPAKLKQIIKEYRGCENESGQE